MKTARKIEVKISNFFYVGGLDLLVNATFY
jgi:hypothetical protein